MSSLKNWNWKHGLIALAFVVGVVWSGGAAIAALPAGTSASAALMALLPVAILGISHIVAFFKNPPADPAEALKDGEQALASNAAAKASVALRTLVTLAVGALALFLMFGSTQGCSWFQKNEPVVIQYGEKDVACVFSAITGGAASVAAVGVMCGGLTASQVAAIAVNLFDFYALSESDAGLAGAALPPAPGLPSALSPDQFAKLRAFVGR